MARQQVSKKANGYTLSEMLMVLLIAAIFLQIGTVSYKGSLDVFMKELEERILLVQMDAYQSKQKTQVSVGSTSLEANGNTWDYPDGIACSTATFTFNGNGNISKGGSIVCEKGNKTRKMVIQIGSGKMRIE